MTDRFVNPFPADSYLDFYDLTFTGEDLRRMQEFTCCPSVRVKGKPISYAMPVEDMVWMRALLQSMKDHCDEEAKKPPTQVLGSQALVVITAALELAESLALNPTTAIRFDKVRQMVLGIQASLAAHDAQFGTAEPGDMDMAKVQALMDADMAELRGSLSIGR